ncbi:MAG: hypothetical protein EA383_04735 [Spirochaetaceae bacterium]|nr:MAG: hypothetical protein EA383_04735 [Spirochaetaceae bacterium]
MPIQPMDLQVLFSRLDNLSRETMGERNMLAQSQAVAGSEIAEKSQEQARSVSTAEDVSEGPDSIHDENEQEQREGRGRKHEGETSEQDSEGIVFRDPDLGGTIDISG